MLTTWKSVCLGGLPVRQSTNESSSISFHGNSISMVSGQHELTSNHRCVESWLCPFQYFHHSSVQWKEMEVGTIRECAYFLSSDFYHTRHKKRTKLNYQSCPRSPQNHTRFRQTLFRSRWHLVDFELQILWQLEYKASLKTIKNVLRLVQTQKNDLSDPSTCKALVHTCAVQFASVFLTLHNGDCVCKRNIKGLLACTQTCWDKTKSKLVVRHIPGK